VKFSGRSRIWCAGSTQFCPGSSKLHGNDDNCAPEHLIYNAKNYEGIAKDYEFSRRTMEELWVAGYEDVVRAISHPEIMQIPDKMEGVGASD
jgi:NTE family protein